MKTMNFIIEKCQANGIDKEFNKEENEEKVKTYKDASKEEQEIIFLTNTRLVFCVFQRYYTVDAKHHEDLMVAGMIGLTKALKKYEPGRNNKFATFAGRCIENEILMCLRKISRYDRNHIEMDGMIASDEIGHEMTFHDILEAKVDNPIETSYKQGAIVELTKYLKELPERDQQIMIEYYGLYGHETLTQKQVAKGMSLSQSYISRKRNIIEKTLKKRLINDSNYFK